MLSPKVTEGVVYSLIANPYVPTSVRLRLMSAHVNDLWHRLFVQSEYVSATNPLRGSGRSHLLPGGGKNAAAITGHRP